MRDVFEAASNEGKRLVSAEVRLDHSRVLLVHPFEVVLEGREPEKPVLLLLAVERDLVDQAGITGTDLVLPLEVGAARAVPAFVGSLVDVPVLLHPLDHRLDPFDVALVGGANEKVVRRIDLRHHVAEALGAAVDQLLRREALFLGRLGGDEFIVILPQGRENEANDTVQKIKDAFAAFSQTEQLPFTLSASIGCAISDKHSPGRMERLLKEADEKMYRDKTAG